MPISSSKSCVWNITCPNFLLMVAWSEIHFWEAGSTPMLVKKIIYPWKRILIIYYNILQLVVVYTYTKGTILFSQTRPKIPKMRDLVEENPYIMDLSIVLSTILTLMVHFVWKNRNRMSTWKKIYTKVFLSRGETPGISSWKSSVNSFTIGTEWIGGISN